MKIDHQIARSGRFDFPLTHDERRHTGDEHRPAHSNDSFTGTDAAARCFTRGEHDEIRFQIELHQFPRFEEPVIGRTSSRKREVRIHWRGVVERSMRRKMEDFCVRRFALDAILERCSGDQALTPVA